MASTEQELLSLAKELHTALERQQASKPHPAIVGVISLIVALVMGSLGGIYAAGGAAKRLESQERQLEKHQELGSHSAQGSENRRLWETVNDLRIAVRLHQKHLEHVDEQIDVLQRHHAR